MVKFHGLFDTICGEVPKRLKGLASNTSRRVTPVRGFKSPSLRQSKTKKPLRSTKALMSAAFSVYKIHDDQTDNARTMWYNMIYEHSFLRSYGQRGRSEKMAFRTLEISRPAEVHVCKGQLVVTNEEETFSIPLEDLSTIVCSGPNIRYGRL